tara:strand:- start:123 stop:887 length:765 start_codon:yes stop_codon:yes gene_type:complete
MYIHNLDPIAFTLFNLKVYWYSLSYLFGFLFSYFYAKYLIKKGYFKINFSNFEDFLGWAVLGVVFGGRIGYVIFYNIDFYYQNPTEILKIWNGGMSFHGGLLGLIFTVVLYSRFKKINYLDLFNLVSTCSPFGLFLGRLANFINGELIGRPTNSTWGVVFEENDVLRHPSQIYEAIFEGLVIFLIILFILKKKYHLKLNIFSVFLVLYGSFRFLLEFFRQPDSHLGFILINLSMGQLLCLPMVLFGFVFIKYKK